MAGVPRRYDVVFWLLVVVFALNVGIYAFRGDLRGALMWTGLGVAIGTEHGVKRLRWNLTPGMARVLTLGGLSLAVAMLVWRFRA